MNITTTHDVHGGGDARLIVIGAGHEQDSPQQRTHPLRLGTSIIGDGLDADVRLSGLLERHAEVRRDADDEYVLVNFDTGLGAMVNGRSVTAAILRSGDRVSIGHWTLTYWREEYADHGRPHGGRMGGEGSRQGHQQRPRRRGTSPGGGSEPTPDDVGEYF